MNEVNVIGGGLAGVEAAWQAAQLGAQVNLYEMRPLKQTPAHRTVPLAIFYFVILLPMRNRQKKVQEFQSSLKVGDKIVTTGGIYGQITRVNDKSVQLQIADKVRIEIARASVGGYQGQEPIVPDAANS